MFIATVTLSGFSFAAGDRFLDRLEPAIGESAHADLGAADLPDQFEGAVVIVDHAHGRRGQQPHVEQADGVSVRLRILDLARAGRAAGRGVVHDDDRLRKQLLPVDRLLQQTRHHVGLAAGRDRDDQADRLLGIARSRSAADREAAPRPRASRHGAG